MMNTDMKPKTQRAILSKLDQTDRRLEELESKSFIFFCCVVGCLFLNSVLAYRIIFQ